MTFLSILSKIEIIKCKKKKEICNCCIITAYKRFSYIPNIFFWATMKCYNGRGERQIRREAADQSATSNKRVNNFGHVPLAGIVTMGAP